MKSRTYAYTVRVIAFLAGVIAIFALSQLLQWSQAEALVLNDPPYPVTLEKNISDNKTPDPYLANEFSFTITGTSATGTPVNETVSLNYYTDDTANATVYLPVGTYSISEDGPNDFVSGEWTVQWSGYGCDDYNGPIAPTTLTVTTDETANVCRADNQWRHGNLRVVKEFVGTSSPFENFSFQVTQGLTERYDGPFDNDGDMEIVVAEGDYKVEETIHTGYSVSYSVDCNENGEGTMAQGGSETCIITNTYTGNGGNNGTTTTGTIIIEKQTDPDGNQTPFNFNPSWSDSDFILSDGDQHNSGALATGTYSVVEDAVSGWTQSSAVCSDGSPLNAISLQAGETVTCVVTNTQDTNGGGDQCVDEFDGSWADDVVSSDRGLRLDGSAVLAERSNPDNTLGSADGNFFSLGFGGEIIVEFDSYVPDITGDDFTVYEVTNGDGYPEESVEVYVRQVTGTSTGAWHLLGEANNLSGDNTTSFDFDWTGLLWINQIRLLDTTDSSDFTDTYNDTNMPDGFDLDAIEVVQQVCDEPGDGGNGGDEDTYLVWGYVWHDENENDNWEKEDPDAESDLDGWTVQITNGEDTFSTTTDATGYYYFYVPKGTWTINEVLQDNWEQTYPNVNGHVVVVDGGMAQAPAQNFFAQVMSFVIPTALAAEIDDNDACDPFCGPHDFGNVFRGDGGGGYSQGSYGGGNGQKIELTSGGGSNDDDNDNGPTPQVLGEATSIVPLGAPYTGAGGAAPVVSYTYLFSALLSARNTTRVIHEK